LFRPCDLPSLNAWTISIILDRVTDSQKMLERIYLPRYCLNSFWEVVILEAKLLSNCIEVTIKRVACLFWVCYINIINRQFRNINVIFTFGKSTVEILNHNCLMELHAFRVKKLTIAYHIAYRHERTCHDLIILSLPARYVSRSKIL